MSPGLPGGAGANRESEIMDQIHLFTCLFVSTVYWACSQDPDLGKFPFSLPSSFPLGCLG